MRCRSTTQDFVDVSCPALVVRGPRDRVVPQRWAEQVTCLLPGQLRVVSGVTHPLTYTNALELARVTEGFLS